MTAETTGSATAAPAQNNPAQQSVRPPASKRIGTFSLALMIIAASAPLTVLAGGVSSNYGVTGLLGVPLSFLILGVILALFAVGYAALSARVRTAGAFYAYVARGLGRVTGVSAAWVALLAYNAMQVGIYGMFGFASADTFNALFGIDVPWWVYALAGWVLVGILGVNSVDLSAKVLGVLVVIEFIIVFAYDFFAVIDAPSGLSADGFMLGDLFAPGVGAVLAFSMAAFMGFESGSVYVEEVKDPENTVRRATFGAVIAVAIFYAVSAWAMIMALTPEKTVAEAGEQGPGVVFSLFSAHIPNSLVVFAQVMFVTSLIAALISFHNVVARYLRTLAREGAMPKFLAISLGRGQAPALGSICQSSIALAVLIVFAIAGSGSEDPIMFPVVTLFTWLTNVGSFGLIALMALTSFAAMAYLGTNAPEASMWTRFVAPLLAGLSLSGVVVLIITNFSFLVGISETSPLNWILPGLVVLAALFGGIWAAWLRSAHPDRYLKLGGGEAAELEWEPAERN